VSGAPWWRSYFDSDFFDLHDALFPEALSRREVAGMRELLALPHGARVLDAPCGWGRHTELLAEAGLDAWGADLSWDLLRRAPRPRAGDGQDNVAQQPPAYAAADIRALPFRDAAFDAVINVFTSLGLFLDDDEDRAALREARRLLRPGGALLLESMHRDDVIRSFAARDEWTLPDGTHVQVRRRFDAITGISHERLRWRRGQHTGRKAHALRLRTATDIDALLRSAGFSDIEYFGGWDGRPFRASTPSLIAIAR
jgi:ubiquinone/menaquinone biosynthesis C-methylase UbiE